MSSTDLDMPLTPSADQIRRREFVSVRRGYDPEQVRAYLKQVGDQVEALEERVRAADARAAEAVQARAELEVKRLEAPPAPAKEDIYADLSERMAEMLRTAERQADDVRKDADEERAKMIAEARSEADRIRTDSLGKAEEALQEVDDVMRAARREAEQMLSGLWLKRDVLVAQLEEMRDELLSMDQGQVSRQGSQASLDPSGIGLTPVPEPEPESSSIFADPQFAELWADPDADTDPDPASFPPVPTLDDVEPEDPPLL